MPSCCYREAKEYPEDRQIWCRSCGAAWVKLSDTAYTAYDPKDHQV